MVLRGGAVLPAQGGVQGWSAEMGVEVNLGEGEETDGYNEPG